jgi:hypothetical protein
VTTSTPAVRARLLWTGGILAAAVVAAVGVELKGYGSRTTFSPPPDFHGARWAAVNDAGEAVRVWGEAGLRGRKVLLLTGRWAQVKSMGLEPAETPAEPGASPDQLDANTAVLAAARSGIARELAVVMPPEAFRSRLEEVGTPKELRRGNGWFTLPFHGYPRRFSVPEAAVAPHEPVLALVEPSFFAEGAPAALEAWLRDKGFDVELGLVALADPAATAAQRDRAVLFAEGTRAVAVEVQR